MHPQNRFWSVLSYIFDEDIPVTIIDKKNFLKRHNIALWDVLDSCEIRGSEDSSIKNPIPNNINKIIKNSKVKKIYTTGMTAYKLYNKYIFKSVGIEAIYLPSTSGANAKMNFDKLVQEYKKILK